MTWHEHAACRGMDPNLFVPPVEPPAGLTVLDLERRMLNQVAPVCAACPVQSECIAASDYWDTAIRAGMTARMRRNAARRGAGPAKCGTRSGYVRHRARNTEVCDACREANNAYHRARKVV